MSRNESGGGQMGLSGTETVGDVHFSIERGIRTMTGVQAFCFCITAVKSVEMVAGVVIVLNVYAPTG
jgi:hypothetical protein